MNKPLFSFLFFFLFTSLLHAQAPTGLSGTGYRTTVHLQWDDYTAFTAVGFNIYRSETSGSYGAPARRIGAYSDYTDYNLTASTTYFYKVAAFDEAGNESPLSSEITVSTNENDYLKVASLDLLVPIYKGGLTATAPQEIRQGLEFAREIFFRNSHAQLNLKFHFWEIDGFPPPNADGEADFNTIGADLTARGILDNQYDAIHIEAVQLYGWRGGALWLGETAGSMGYNWTGFDPDNHYSRGDAWLFTHEFGHSLDLIIAKRSGFPEMLFNHFAWAHPMPADIGVFDAGEDFDGMGLILRLFEHHLDYQAPYDGYLEVLDADHDGLPDGDGRLVCDEMRFGSSPNLPDTDDDGLHDLDEFTADVYQGSNPNLVDTDGDGVIDGVDLYPASNFQPTNEKAVQPIDVDGLLEADEPWNTMGSSPFYSKIPNATLNSFTTWDDEYLYFAFQSNQHLKYFLKLDASGEDGIFASPVKWPGGDYSSINENGWGDAYFDQATLIIRADDTQVHKLGNPIAGSVIATVLANGTYTTEVKIPHNLGPGFGYNYVYPNAPEISELVFTEGDVIGVQLLGMPLAQSNAYEWNEWRTNDWLILDQPFHYYDMVLQGGASPPGNYCNAYSDFPWEDWIAHIAVGSIDNASSKTPYSDFTNLSTDLTAGSSPGISLTAGYSYFTWDEYWRVWIDFNQNGDFTDPGEMVLSSILSAPPNGTQTNTLNANLTIPANAMTGSTRMRIAMKRNGFPTPCEILPFGEIEDYTVNIIPSNGGQLPNLQIVAPEIIPANSNCFTNPGQSIGFLGGLVLNNGMAPAGPFKAKAFLSKDDQADANDIFWEAFTYTGVQPNNVASWSVTEPVPMNVSPGQYYVFIIADTDNEVAETNENDNLLMLTTQIGAPDFTISSISGIPTVGSQGSLLTISTTVSNLAGFPLLELSGDLALEVYLSDDDIFNFSGDTEIGNANIPYGQFSNGPLFEFGNATTNIASHIPDNISDGEYFVFLRIANGCDAVFQNNISNPIPIKIETGTPGDYCNSYSEYPWEDWIGNVQVADLTNPSAKSTYSDFTDKSANANAGESYTVKLSTGYSYFTWDEYWRIWIDFNADGDFTDAGEMVFSEKMNAPPDGTTKGLLIGQIHIPANAPTGISTRMRISMKRDAFPTPCEILPFGEVEDYTINIGSPPACDISFATGNVQCYDGGTPNVTDDDTFTFEILVTGTGVSQNWQVTWPGGSTSGVFTVVKTVGPLPISQFPDGLHFTISDNNDPYCSTVGSVQPPAPCSVLPADCGFSKNYNNGNNYQGTWAMMTPSGYRAVGSQALSAQGISFVDISTDDEGQQTGSTFANLPRQPNEDVYQLRDGNYVFLSVAASEDIQLIKKTGTSSVVWSKTYNIPNAETIALGNLIETPSGGLVIVGSVDESTNSGFYPKFFALKANGGGMLQWLKIDPEVPSQQGFLVGRIFGQTQNGGFLIYQEVPNTDKFIGRLSAAGDLIWKTKITGTPLNAVVDASETTDGSILASYVSSAIPGPSFDHVNFVKLDPSGNIAWTKSQQNWYGQELNPFFIDYRRPYTAAAPNGGFTVAFTGVRGLYLTGVDMNGNKTWENIYDFEVVPSFLEQTAGGGYLLTGSEDNKLWLMKTDAQGNICGTPPAGDYCTVASEFPWEDWIAGVELNTLDNTSGKLPYSDFTSISTTLEKGVDYPIHLTAGYSYFTWDEYWSVWIDFNQDNIFSQDELLVSEIMMRPPDGTTSKIISGNLNIPTNAVNGSTRMRVVMKRGAFADACENIPFGEMEDYTINIVDQFNGPDTEDRAIDIALKAAQEKTWINLYSAFIFTEKINQVEIEKSADNISFDLLKAISKNELFNGESFLEAKDEQPLDGPNYYRLLFILENGEEIYSDVALINFNILEDVTIFPNPAASDIFIALNKIPEQAMTWTINDAYGRTVWMQKINAENTFPYRVDVSHLKPGLYYLFVQRPGVKAKSRRFVVAR